MKTISGHYLYVLFRENGQPFYIGIGTGKRISLSLNPNNGGNRHKSAVLRSTKDVLGSVPWVFLHTGLDMSTAKQYESTLIAAIGRAPNGPLVNLTDGGDGIRNVCPESAKRISAKLKGNRNAVGTVCSLETRALLSAAKIGNTHAKGHKQTDEHKQKKSASGAYKTDEFRRAVGDRTRGRKWSEEIKNKIAASLRGNKASQETRDKMKAAWARKRMERLQAQTVLEK